VDLTIVAIPAFLGLLALELVVARWKGRDIQEARDTWTSLAMGVGSVVVGLGWAWVENPAWDASHRLALFDLGSGAWAWLGAIVGVDFAYYWFHRLHHELRVLWASHVPHHSSQRYNLSTALRQTWTPFTALPFYLPLAWLGFPLPLIATAHGINLLYQFWIHTELIDRLGPLEWVFNTPSHHRVHHGANVQYLDRNYAGILIVWDRWFGTFEPERERVRYGLTKNIATSSPPSVAFHEWFAVFRDALGAGSLRDALGFLLRPPGWRPRGEGVTATDLKRSAGLTPAAPLACGSLRGSGG
jgi:sterol desaturase/sphingolipid hydroxylase (fatty acid hydroxylase superfamily)